MLAKARYFIFPTAPRIRIGGEKKKKKKAENVSIKSFYQKLEEVFAVKFCCLD